jgi:hypothetical protein
MTPRKYLLPFFVALTVCSSHVQAQLVIASDNAANGAYNDGWQTGDNGNNLTNPAPNPPGFGAWTLAQNGGTTFFFVSSSSGNGANNNSGNIDTASKSWGMAAGDGRTGTATRGFTSSLNVGDTFRVSMDNGFIDTNGVVGFALRSGTTDRFNFSFTGGQSDYKLNGMSTGVAYTTGGLDLAVTITDTGYSASIQRRVDSSPVLINGSLLGSGAVNQFHGYNNNAGYNNNNLYFNSMSITAVPEPGTILGGLALIGLVGLREGRRLRRIGGRC